MYSRFICGKVNKLKRNIELYYDYKHNNGYLRYFNNDLMVLFNSGSLGETCSFPYLKEICDQLNSFLSFPMSNAIATTNKPLYRSDCGLSF